MFVCDKVTQEAVDKAAGRAVCGDAETSMKQENKSEGDLKSVRLTSLSREE
jgi:hypothetical protein